MNAIEERIKLWRSLIDHPRYKHFNLVLYEYMCRIHRKEVWSKYWANDVSGFYL